MNPALQSQKNKSNCMFTVRKTSNKKQILLWNWWNAALTVSRSTPTSALSEIRQLLWWKRRPQFPKCAILFKNTLKSCTSLFFFFYKCTTVVQYKWMKKLLCEPPDWSTTIPTFLHIMWDDVPLIGSSIIHNIRHFPGISAFHQTTMEGGG